jgi:hypothetical protein|tara:strand:+ start:270658 stop:270780 length:123 start_codon:yes stop_codon:yes gene_type:complete
MTLRDYSDRQARPAERRLARREFRAWLVIAVVGLMLGLAL